MKPLPPRKGSALITVLIFSAVLAIVMGALTTQIIHEIRFNARSKIDTQAKTVCESIIQYGHGVITQDLTSDQAAVAQEQRAAQFQAFLSALQESGNSKTKSSLFWGNADGTPNEASPKLVIERNRSYLFPYYDALSRQYLSRRYDKYTATVCIKTANLAEPYRKVVVEKFLPQAQNPASAYALFTEGDLILVDAYTLEKGTQAEASLNIPKFTIQHIYGPIFSNASVFMAVNYLKIFGPLGAHKSINLLSSFTKQPLSSDDIKQRFPEGYIENLPKLILGGNEKLSTQIDFHFLIEPLSTEKALKAGGPHAAEIEAAKLVNQAGLIISIHDPKAGFSEQMTPKNPLGFALDAGLRTYVSQITVDEKRKNTLEEVKLNCSPFLSISRFKSGTAANQEPVCFNGLYDARREAYVDLIVLDMEKLNTSLQKLLLSNPQCAFNKKRLLYIELPRSDLSLMVINAEKLPTNERNIGFSLVTNRALYLRGSYNSNGVVARDDANTILRSASTQPDNPAPALPNPPALIAADMITVLSKNFDPKYSQRPAKARDLQPSLLKQPSQEDVVICAAIVTGTSAPLNATNTSNLQRTLGIQVEDVQRTLHLLEDWPDREGGIQPALCLRGSLMVLFRSKTPQGLFIAYNPKDFSITGYPRFLQPSEEWANWFLKKFPSNNTNKFYGPCSFTYPALQIGLYDEFEKGHYPPGMPQFAPVFKEQKHYKIPDEKERTIIQFQ